MASLARCQDRESPLSADAVCGSGRHGPGAVAEANGTDASAPRRHRDEAALGRSCTRGRPRGVVAATTGLLGLSSTRRAAILAVVVCALALSVAVPLRNYVAQRQELAAVTQRSRP